MARQIRHLGLAFAAALLGIALAGGYWGGARSAALVERPDNPRRVLTERRVPRGTIYDRNRVVLAESAGAPGSYERHYPYPWLAPVLGYISPLYGSAGIEAAADPVLHGDAGHDPLPLLWQEGILGAPPPGRAIQLTIDLRVQQAADDALAGRVGAAIVLNAATGEILALASHPTFDPNALEEQWPALVEDSRAPLLNRATFALYQPGGAIWPVVVASALQHGEADLQTVYSVSARGLEVGSQNFPCRVYPRVETISLVEALFFGCPEPIALVGRRLGAGDLERAFGDFQFFEAPDLAIATAGSEPSGEPTPELDAIGQGRLTITPLHLARATAAIARHGRMPVPQILVATQAPDLSWRAEVPRASPVTVLAPEFADQIKTLLRGGYTAVAHTGAEGQRLAWFSGFGPFEDSRYIVVVLLEDGDVDAAREIGQALLQAAIGNAD